MKGGAGSHVAILQAFPSILAITAQLLEYYIITPISKPDIYYILTQRTPSLFKIISEGECIYLKVLYKTYYSDKYRDLFL